MSTSSALGQAFNLIGGHFATLFGIVFVVHLPWVLHQAYLLAIGNYATLNDPEVFSIHDVLYIGMPVLLAPLANAAVVYAVFQLLRRREITFGDALGRGFARLLPVFGVAIVTGILIGIGTLLLIIPGLLLSLMFYVAIPAAVVEKVGVGGAIKRSASLTEGNRLSIFGLVILVSLISAIPVGVSALLLAGSDQNAPVFVTLDVLVNLFATLLNAIAAAVVYHDLRVDKEGVDTDSLAAVFD